MRLVDTYLFREIIKPFLLITILVTFIFATFSMARYTDEALGGTLGLEVLAQLVALQCLIALEVIIPIALFLGIVVGLGKLHGSLEITAFQAAGVSRYRIYLSVLLLSIPICLLATFLSLFGRPWAYLHIQQTEALAEAEFRIEQLQPGRFHGVASSNRVVYAGGIGAEQQTMSDVFIYRRHAGGRTEIIIADSARKSGDRSAADSYMQLYDGVSYRLYKDSIDDRVVHFDQLDLRLETTEPEIGFRRKSAATSVLFGSSVPNQIAELQWRLSRPFTTMILALFAVALSWFNPARSTTGQLIPAIGVYIVFYNIMELARTWVEQGIVGAVPGIWWVHVLMLAFFAAVLERQNLAGWLRER
jgi:lipopolysaccharide export system permease protein